MSKAMLEFTLPEEQVDHQLALDGWKWRTIVNDVDNHLRNLSKYQNLVDIPIDRVRKLISDTLEEHGLSLND